MIRHFSWLRREQLDGCVIDIKITDGLYFRELREKTIINDAITVMQQNRLRWFGMGSLHFKKG